MSDLESHVINELKDGYTKSGLSTNEWSVTITEDTLEVTETTFEKSGEPSFKAPIIRVSPQNCLDKEVMATLGVDLKEKETTTWTLTTDVTISREIQLSATGDIVIGEGTASTKTGVSFKIGGSASNTTEEEVVIKYSQEVPVRPKHQTILEVKVFSTPVSGTIKGFRKVRVRYQYDLDIPYSPFDSTHTGTALVRIPFEVRFTSEIISFVPTLREREVNCQIGFRLPGEEGYTPMDHPLFGIPAQRTGIGYFASVASSSPYSLMLAKLDAILDAANVAETPEKLASYISWSGDKLALANKLYNFVREQPERSAENAISNGIIDFETLETIRISTHADTTNTGALQDEDIRRIEDIGDKRAEYLNTVGIRSLSDLANLSLTKIESLKVRNLSKRSLLSASNQARLLKNTDLNSNEAEAISELGIRYPIQPHVVRELMELTDEQLDARLSKTRLPNNITASDVRTALARLM